MSLANLEKCPKLRQSADWRRSIWKSKDIDLYKKGIEKSLKVTDR